MEHLAAQGIGHADLRAASVPLVFAAVVYDLMLGDGSVRPRATAAAVAACEAAGTEVARGSVGVGHGLHGGQASRPRRLDEGRLRRGDAAWSGDATVTALAAVNAFGDPRGGRCRCGAGVWTGGRLCPHQRTSCWAGETPARAATAREHDARLPREPTPRLDKREAWLVARAGSAGVARAIAPSATAADGDLVVCAATGDVPADAFLLSALAPEVIAAAVRDAVASATGAPGLPCGLGASAVVATRDLRELARPR